MPDYRSMYDSEYIGHWDLIGHEPTVEIARVEGKKLRSEKGENKKPIIYFKGKEKGFVCNKTNGKTIAGMYGADTEKWVGKKITLYATTCQAFGQTVECIRVKNVRPK